MFRRKRSLKFQSLRRRSSDRRRLLSCSYYRRSCRSLGTAWLAELQRETSQIWNKAPLKPPESMTKLAIEPSPYGSTKRHRPVDHIDPMKMVCVPSVVVATLFGPQFRASGISTFAQVPTSPGAGATW